MPLIRILVDVWVWVVFVAFNYVMVEKFEGIQNIVKYGEVDLTLRVLPIMVESKVVFFAAVTGYFVVSLED